MRGAVATVIFVLLGAAVGLFFRGKELMAEDIEAAGELCTMLYSLDDAGCDCIADAYADDASVLDYVPFLGSRVTGSDDPAVQAEHMAAFMRHLEAAAEQCR